MSFWSENYSFIKDVYDTRVCKMVEWMDHVEMAITKVMATKVYTSAEFKRERDNFLSLIKNMEKTDTKKWLDEVKETLFRDRAGDERKDEYTRLEAVIEKHQNLIPRVTETQVKSEVFWKCYEYGDDLIQIFEFIDDQRAKSVRDVIIGDTEATEELMDKHGSIMRIMENKRKTVEEFIVKGEKLMEDPKSPKFLETHVNKLKEAWDVAQQKAQERKDALGDNLESWKIFDAKKVECAKSLDSADKHFKSIKRVYDLEKGPADLADKLKVAAAMRAEIEDFFGQVDTANNTLQIFLPLEMKEGMHSQVKVLKDRMVVLGETDQALAEIFKFNQELAEFDKTLTSLQEWLDGKAKEKLEHIRKPQDALLPPDPEEKCGKVLELAEDLLKKSNICKTLEEKKDDMFPKEGQKMSRDAKEFLERLKALRDGMTTLDNDINKEFEKYSGDVRHFAEYQTGLQEFYPSLVEAEDKVNNGLPTPDSLVSAEACLADTKSFQSGLEDLIKILDNAATIAQKMSHHEHADITVASFRMRWENTHKISKQWVHCINELVECWSQLEGKIEELTKWVEASKSSEPGAQAGLSIDKLEEQLNLLKISFKEKQGLVESMNKTCKSKLSGRRKSQVLMNVRRMTMLPVEEMRKLSNMVANQPEDYPDAPTEEEKKEGEVEAKEGEEGNGDVSVSATIKLPPAENAEAAPES
jgi:soluble cytochrome b562